MKYLFATVAVLAQWFVNYGPHSAGIAERHCGERLSWTYPILKHGPRAWTLW
jgi:hypothetical protein